MNGIIFSLSLYASTNIFSIEYALEISNIMNASISQQAHQLYQIKEYHWVSDVNLRLGMDRVKYLGIVKHDNISEISVQLSINIPKQNLEELREKYHLNENNLDKRYLLVGSIDCVCETTQYIYEFKCVSVLTNEHYVQLAIYKYMYDTQNPLLPKKKSMIYNILTDELVEVVGEEADMKMIIESILLSNCITKKEDDNDKFIEEINKFKSTMNVWIPEVVKKIPNGLIYAYLILK